MSLNIKFGTYEFGNNIDSFEIDDESRLNIVAIPRRHGYLSDEAYRGGLTIVLSGIIMESTDTLARTALNTLKNAFNLGKQNLYLYDDRYIECQKQSFSYSYDQADLRHIRWSCTLVSDSSAFSSITLTTSERIIEEDRQGETFVNNGNVETYPIIRITAGSTEIASGIRIENLTTGKVFYFNNAIGATVDQTPSPSPSYTPSGTASSSPSASISASPSGTPSASPSASISPSISTSQSPSPSPTQGDLIYYIEVDTDKMTVTDQDGNSHFEDFQGDFFTLQSGSNVLVWKGTFAGFPRLTLIYRDCYDGA